MKTVVLLFLLLLPLAEANISDFYSLLQESNATIPLFSQNRTLPRLQWEQKPLTEEDSEETTLPLEIENPLLKQCVGGELAIEDIEDLAFNCPLKDKASKEIEKLRDRCLTKKCDGFLFCTRSCVFNAIQHVCENDKLFLFTESCNLLTPKADKHYDCGQFAMKCIEKLEPWKPQGKIVQTEGKNGTNVGTDTSSDEAGGDGVNPAESAEQTAGEEEALVAENEKKKKEEEEGLGKKLLWLWILLGIGGVAAIGGAVGLWRYCVYKKDKAKKEKENKEKEDLEKAKAQNKPPNRDPSVATLTEVSNPDRSSRA